MATKTAAKTAPATAEAGTAEAGTAPRVARNVDYAGIPLGDIVMGESVYVYLDGGSAHLRITAVSPEDGFSVVHVGANGEDSPANKQSQKVSAFKGRLIKAREAKEGVTVSAVKPSANRSAGVSATVWE